MQWKYIAGNNWGICPDGNGAVGCGDQEEFRACADVAIGKGEASAIPTIKPPTRRPATATDKWPTDEPNVEENEIDHEHDEANAEDKPPQSNNFFGAVIAVFTFFLVLCTIAAIYIYFYHGDLLKDFLNRCRNNSEATSSRLTTSTARSSVSSAMTDSTANDPPPARPPRTKRLSQTLKDVHNDHVVITSNGNKEFDDF